MDFTREPIIESVITPKEGCKLVVRSSKGAGQEEFFVDAVEMVSFGGTFFLRSLEKPKAFLVPASDYEILEVRETRMVLKNVGVDRSIKIGGGRGESTPKRAQKEVVKPPVPVAPVEPTPEEKEKPEPKKRERRRHYRKRRGGELAAGEQQASEKTEDEQQPPKRVRIPPPETFVNLEKEGIGKPINSTTSVLSSLLPPPPTLISESIERYKGNELFKNVFIPKGELDKKKAAVVEEEHEFADEPTVEIETPFSQDRYSEDDIFDLPELETPETETISEAVPEVIEETIPEEAPTNVSVEPEENI